MCMWVYACALFGAFCGGPGVERKTHANGGSGQLAEGLNEDSDPNHGIRSVPTTLNIGPKQRSRVSASCDL